MRTRSPCVTEAVFQDSPADAKVTWAQIKTALSGELQKVIEGKFFDPKAHDAEITANYNKITEEIITAFQQFTDTL